MKRVVLLAATLMALAVAAPSQARRTSHSMQWFRWHRPARALAEQPLRAGSRAVLGVAAMRDLGPLRTRYGFAVTRALPTLHAAEIRVSEPLLRGAATDPRVRYLSAVTAAQQLFSVPDAPFLTQIDPLTGRPYEWQFDAANVGPALDLSAGSPTIAVGTIDSGTAELPDLAGKVDSRWTVSPAGTVTPDTGAEDYLGHGTAVASLVAANGFGMAGFGGATHIVSIHLPMLTDVAVAVALLKLDSLGVRIVNMSFGGPAPERPIVLDAIGRAEADGMLLVAAAGNSQQQVAHPAADLQSSGGEESAGLAVGASDVDGHLAFFSNYGDDLSLVAPGVFRGRCSGVLVAAPLSVEFVTSCYPSWGGSGGSSYAYVAGTSFSAPEVAGIAALIWAARPTLTNYQVADILRQSARRPAGSGWTPTMGCGQLDAGAALELALSRTNEDWAAAGPAAAPCSAVG